MIESGAVLDLHAGMTPVTCAMIDGFGGETPKGTATESGKIHQAAEIFPRHVLVVDDEPLIRWSVAESLSDLGFDVEQAPDAGDALRKVTTAAAPFDIVVLDLRLPDMDDLSLLGTIRQLLPAAGLILMTAFGTPEIIKGAVDMGASVLNKPFELDELQRLVLSCGTQR